MGMQRYDAYYQNDFNDKLSAMLERSEVGDLVLYADAQERERVQASPRSAGAVREERDGRH